MKVKSAWWVKGKTYHVIRTSDGELKRFQAFPLQAVTESVLSPVSFRDFFPARVKKIPNWMMFQYGLEII